MGFIGFRKKEVTEREAAYREVSLNLGHTIDQLDMVPPSQCAWKTVMSTLTFLPGNSKLQTQEVMSGLSRLFLASGQHPVLKMFS